ALALHHRPHLDRPAEPRSGKTGCEVEGLVEVVRLDEEEAAEDLLRVGERAIGGERLPVLDADGGRALRRVQLPVGGDAGLFREREELAPNRLLLLVGQPPELLGGTVSCVDQQCVPHRFLLQTKRSVTAPTNDAPGKGQPTGESTRSRRAARDAPACRG